MTSPKHPLGVRRLFRLRFTPSALHHEVEDEIRFHVESRAADLVAQGMTPEAAREQAMRDTATSRKATASSSKWTVADSDTSAVRKC